MIMILESRVSLSANAVADDDDDDDHNKLAPTTGSSHFQKRIAPRSLLCRALLSIVAPRETFSLESHPSRPQSAASIRALKQCLQGSGASIRPSALSWRARRLAHRQSVDGWKLAIL